MSTSNEETQKTPNPPSNETKETKGSKEQDVPKVKKFNNSWTSELENLIGDWADRAQCYRWMHDKTSRIFGSYNQYMMIPVIILSTLTGTANFGMDSLFSQPDHKRIATLAIGGVGILTGIITTMANFLRYGQGSESHSISSIAWAKFSRLITIELALNPNDRMEAFAFLKMFRIELDRLIEQSPSIPESVIRMFKQEFRMLADVKRPDVTGAIEHTRVFDNKNQRLKAVAAEAALMLLHKKQFVKELALADLDKRVRAIIDNSNRPIVANPLMPQLHTRSPIILNTISENLPGEITISVDDEHKRQYDKE